MGISALLASQILDASATGRSVLTGADASAIRSTLGLGTLSTQSPTGTPSASTFLRGDYSWQTIDLSGYVPYTGATGSVNLGSNAFTASRATLSTGTITASTPAINVTQTWNNAATTFTGILADFTKTAASASSLLIDLKLNGVSKLRADEYNLYIPGNTTTEGFQGYSGAGIIVLTGQGLGPTLHVSGARLSSSQAVLWSNGTSYGNTADLYLYRDAAQTLAQRNGTNPQVHRVYNLFTDASNYERAKIAWESNVLRIGTEKAGTGSARALELQTDGTTRLTIASNGTVTTGDLSIANNSLYMGGSGVIRLADYTRIHSPDSYGPIDIAPMTNNVTGVVRVYNTLRSLTNYERLECGQAFNANAFIRTAAGGTGTRRNLEIDAPEITIAVSTTQKLGFYNKTPVVQPTAVADATDAASVITQLNALLSRMRNLGLIAT